MSELLLGNAAVARGAYESGVRFVSSYPGTPSTEITEECVKFDRIWCEWAPNEKVAAEAAIGAAIAGGRALTCCKHVGLNVMADPIFTASYTGVNAGLVVAVADDPGMHSSQNEQDSRHYSKAAKLPMLEPADSAECKEYTKRAYELSERFDTPCFLRLTTRVAHSQSPVELCEPIPVPIKPYQKNAAKYVMVPANAIKRHVAVEDRMRALAEFAEETDLNRIERNGSKIGVIAAGVTYLYAKEALGDNVDYLKLGMVYPLPSEKLLDFAKGLDRVYVLEELDPFIEEHCKALGLSVIGKAAFSPLGEYTVNGLLKAILGFEPVFPKPDAEPPARPPVMCPGCPHRGAFYVLKKLGLTVAGDIGCYTLGAAPPLSSIDTTICMGASVSAAHGMIKVLGDEAAKKTVSVIGDSTFIHSGITGLINTVYNKGAGVVIILDNSITDMTGHQENPTTGKTIRGDATKQVDLELLCRAIGVEDIRVADPFDVKAFEQAVKAACAFEGPSVIVSSRPCALLKGVKYTGRAWITDRCRNCKVCLKLGCPAVAVKDGKPAIDATQCNGCGLCLNVCPFGAIEKKEDD